MVVGCSSSRNTSGFLIRWLPQVDGYGNKGLARDIAVSGEMHQSNVGVILANRLTNWLYSCRQDLMCHHQGHQSTLRFYQTPTQRRVATNFAFYEMILFYYVGEQVEDLYSVPVHLVAA